MIKFIKQMLLMALIIALGAWGLNAQELVRKGSQEVPIKGLLAERVASSSDISLFGKEVFPTPPIVKDEPTRAPGDIILSEGFEGTTGTALPTGWTRSTTSNYYWRTGNASTSWGGYSGLAGALGSSRYVGIPYVEAANSGSWLWTPAMNLTSGVTYSISFYTIVYGYQPDEYDKLRVSIGTAASAVGMTTQLYETTTNHISEWTQINLSFTPTTSGNYYLGFFAFTTAYEGWFITIDNVEVKEPKPMLPNDLAIIADPFPYTQVPVSQMVPPLTAKAENIGTNTQTNVVLSATMNGSNLGSSAPITSLASGATSATMTVTPTAFVPLGDNTLVYTVSQSQTDDDPSNNTATKNFLGAENTFALDNGVPNGGAGNSSPISLGNVFAINQPTVLNAATIRFGANAVTSFSVSLYEVNSTGTGLITPAFFTQPATKTTAEGWVTVMVPATTLTAGKKYFLCANQTGTANFGITVDRAPDKFSCAYLGTTFYPNINTAYGQTMGAVFVRMLVDLPMDDLSASLSSMTPQWVGNPSTYTVTVFNAGLSSQSNYTVQLLDGSDNVLDSQTGTTLASGASANFDFNYTPVAAGNIVRKGKVILVGDENPEDNITNPITYKIYPEEPMRYCASNNGTIQNGIGPTTPPGTFSAAISYLSSAITPFVGKQITAIDIGIDAPPSAIGNCSVWIRSSLTGSNLYSQNFTPTQQGWNSVTLTTPYEILDQNTYIGYTMTINVSSYPMGITNNTQNASNGGHLSTGGTTWTTLAANSFSGNWALIGVVEGEAIPPVCNAPSNLIVNYTTDCNTAQLSWTAPVGGKGSIAPIKPNDFVGVFLPKNKLSANATKQNGNFTAIEMGIGSSVPASKGDIILSPGAFSMPCFSGDLMVYSDENEQYLTGSNGYGDVKFGYIFKGTSGTVTSVNAWLGRGYTGDTENIYAELWAISGDLPTTLLGTSQPISTTNIAVGTLAEYTFTFATPVDVPANFAVSIKVPEYGMTSTDIVLGSTEIGCYAPGTEKYCVSYNVDFAGWEAMNEAWGMSPGGLFDLAIFPVLQGESGGDETHQYNVYAGTTKINTSPITGTTFNTPYNLSSAITWSVKAICGAEESDPATNSKEACETEPGGDCNPPTKLAVQYSADCNTATITWDAPIGGKKEFTPPVIPEGKVIGSERNAERTEKPINPAHITAKDGENMQFSALSFDAPNFKSSPKAGNLIYDNGPFITHVGVGPGGTDYSSINPGENVLGTGLSKPNNFWLADDFTLTENVLITEMEFYVIHQGSINDQVTGIYVEIYDGAPNAGGTVIFGDKTTNRILSSEFSGAYRTNAGSSPSLALPIMKVVANVPVSLTPGTYWVAIAADHVGSLAPFGNPVTVWGELASGNGLKFQGGWSAWIDLADGVGTSAPLDLPFLIYGIVDGTLCDHPVTNLNADVIGNNVALTWTAPAGSPTGYEILFDGELLTTVTGTSYTHNNVPTGNHKYGVSALFAGGCYPQTVYTPNLLVGNFCPLYFIMGDGYGDGWDIGTAYITVEVDGVVYGTVTLEDGSYGTQEVLIPAGILKLYWNVGYSGGNYDDEVYFICYDDDGNTLYETGYNGMYGKYGEFYDDEFFCGEKTYYNVYCGSDLVVGNVTKKSYTTSAYDLFETQTWSVRTVCEDGLSAPISVTKEPCEIDCPAPASLDVVYSPDCGTATLTWEMPTGGKGKMIPIDPNRKGVTDIPVDEKIKERITKMIEAAQARRESGDLPPLKDKTRGADSEAFAFNTSYWAYVSFPLNDPSNMNYINYEPDYCFGHTGADIIDDEWYFVNFRDFCYWTLDYKLYRVDMETGIRTVAGMHDVPQPVGMAYNKADGFVYMISYVGSGYSELYKYDMNTGVTTYINYISGDVWDGGPIVFANDGRCIMLDFNYGDIAELDITTGVTTYLTSTGFYLGTYFQDLAVDRETGDIYWTGMEADYYESVYYRYDLNTNTLTNLGYIESQMTALIIPEGKKYNIYMDGEMIAENVSGNTYKTSEYDLFETHLWEVKAVCFDIYESDPISVTMEPCEVECDSPTALNVEYSEDCNTAFITWDPVAGKGKGKSPMMGNTEKRYVTLPEGYDPSSGISIATFMKDQFTGEMPTPVLNSDGGKSCPVALPYFENFSSCANWALPACWSRPTMINFYGMLIPGVDEYDYYSAPKCVWMFADDVPNYLVTPAIPGNIHKVKMTVALMREGYGSGPMTIGVMSDPNNLSTFEVVEVIDVPDDYTYYMYEVTFEGTTLAGSDRYIAFKQNAADTYSYWIDDVEITIDIVPLYNVYCGGEKIAGPIEETYFDHTGFDKTIGHTWSVTQVCFDIYESDPIEFTLEACDPSVCNAPTTVAAEYSADCNSVTITWGAPEGKSGGKGMSAPENPVIIHEASSEEIEMMNSSIAVMNTNTSVVSKTSNSIAFDEQYIEDKKAALQSRGARAITKPPIVSAPPSKGVIFYEGFEGSSGYDLPSTWTIVNYGYTDDWYAYEEEGYAVDGVYVMSHDDYYDDRDVWAFSPGFELTADVAYNISFYLNMPGYGPGDYDAMEVKIGQAKTASGMTNLVYQKLYEPTGYWDFIEKTFTPTTSGTYYLGIHAMTEAWGGNYIDVDAILIQTAPEPVYYNVYCDGNLLGTTTNLYFNDDTFNNATGHTWSVATVCGDGESERINVTLEVCEIECFPVTNLNAYYGDNCTAELTWDAPTGEGLSGTMTLWDNTNAGIGTGGLISTYWSGNDNWVMCADDFEASGAWTIEKVYTKGFSNSPSVVPTKICLVIFADDDNKPGAELYRNNAIPVASGTDPVITLPTPFTLPSAGKYWIGISGTYDVSVPPSTLANFRWNISYGAGKVGSNYQLHDPSNMFGEGTDWMDASGLVPGSYSMHFKLEGNANNSEIYAYNIYRNGALLTKNHPLPYYSDSGFDAFEGHTWAVTLVCGNDETAPTTVSLASCKVPLCYDTETQTIGSGTIGSQYLPIYHYYNYSYSQQIYDAAEVGGTAYTGRVISAISFYSVRVAPITKNPIMVYLGNTTQATFTSTTNWITAADLQHVHTGTITYGGTPGWVTIQFDEPFIYTGGNVVVALLNDDGSYTDDTQIAFNTTAATNKSLYNGRDTAPILITAPPSGTRPANRNNIKFEFCPIPEWVEITTEVEPAGSGNVTGGGTYAGGATVTLTATAEPGYFFTNWNTGSTNSTITFTAMIDATYTAYFAECLPITELNVQYDPVYCKATLTWDNVDPLYRYNVYRDDVQVATSVVSPYIDSGFDATEGHTWSVTLVCGDGESDPVFETLGPCDVGCDNVIIGTGTTGSYDMPLNTYYSFSYVQHIYTAADVGEAGTIKALAFQYFLGTPNIKNNQVYYLANTTKMDFTSSTDWFPVSEMTQVFAGDLVYDNANEWFVVTLDTPFEYTGCGLVLAVLNNHGSYSTGSSSTFRVSSTTPANRTIQYRKDNSPAGPIDPSALPTATGRSVNRTNTLFHICPTEEPYTPQPPVALTATQIECTSFVANWETVDGAANYLLSVYSEDYEEVIVLEEDFTGLGGNNMDNNGSSTAWAGNANFPTLARAYQAGNAVRLGKGTPTPTDGYITSKPLDLSGGDVIINFDIKGWANYETDLFVSIDGGTPQVVTYTNLMLPGPFEHKTLIFPAATANSTVTFSSQVGASTAKRLFLDNIVISVVQPTNNYIVEDVAVGNGSTYSKLVEGLTPGTTYYYSVKTVEMCLTGESSNEIEVTTLPVYSITVTTGENGTVTPAGPVITLDCHVDYASFTFEADACYEIDEVLINGVNNLAAVEDGYYDFTGITGDQTIEVTFKLITYAITTDTDGNGSITPAEDTVDCGDGVTFTITPDACYELDELWINDTDYASEVVDGTYTIEVLTEDLDIYVTFKLIEYDLDATAGQNGSISPTETTVTCGSEQSFTITPDACYEIDELWDNDVNKTSSVVNNTYTITNITENHSISVTFSRIIYTITASTGPNGFITPSGQVAVECGDEIAFYFEANSGFAINMVYVDGIPVSGYSDELSGDYTFEEVDGNHNIYVTFVPTEVPSAFTIIAGTDEGATITPTGEITVNPGANQKFTFVAKKGYQIVEVLIDGDPDPMALLDGFYTFENVQADHTIYIVCEELEPGEYCIFTDYTAGGTISPNGLVCVPIGTDQTFLITPQQGFKILEVKVDGIVNVQATIDGVYTFSDVQEEHTLYASFTYIAIEQFYINASVSTVGGSVSPAGKVMVTTGDEPKFTFTPQAGYQLKDVLVDGISVMGDVVANVYTFAPVVCAHTIVGTFEKQTLTITSSIGTAGGSISPVGEKVVPYGGSQAYTITTQTGFLIDEVLINGVNNPAAVTSGKYTFSNVTSSQTIVVNFKYRTYDIVATQTANGQVSPPGTTPVVHGSEMTYNIYPNTGYMIKTVLINGKNNVAAVANGYHTFTNVTAKQTISATFAPLTSTLADGESTANELLLYPNPTTGKLTINNGEEAMEEIQVFDLLGKKVMEYKVEDEVSYKIDMTILPAGIYFVRIKTETNVEIRKVVKQ